MSPRQQSLRRKLTQIGFLDTRHDELSRNISLHTLKPNVGGQNFFYARYQLCRIGVAQRDIFTQHVLPVKLSPFHH